MRALFVALTLTVAPAAQAATVLAMDLDSLTRSAEVIVIGSVVDARTAWRGGRIITTTRVRVDTALAGAATGIVEVETKGGIVDGLGQFVAGSAHFTPGERVALFLERPAAGDRGVFLVTGMAQGKFSLVADSDGPAAERSLDGLRLVERGPDGALRAASAAPARRLSASAFVRAVSAALLRR